MISKMLQVLMDRTEEQSMPVFIPDIWLDLTVEGVGEVQPEVLRVSFHLPNEEKKKILLPLKGVWELNKKGLKRNISYRLEFLNTFQNTYFVPK